MLKRFFLLIVGIPMLFGFTGRIVACKWDLEPQVLLITSYQNAQQQSSEDQLIYHQLQKVYGNKVIATVFSYEDDNSYAYILTSLIERFNLKKVFILDPAFLKYFPHDSSTAIKNSNLVRVLSEFNNVDFYFFNNQIANNVKQAANNIYEFRFDVATKNNLNPLTYGSDIVDHFVNQLIVDDGTKEIDANKYNFETNDKGEWVIKIGLIRNIGNEYQERVIDEFIHALLSSNAPVNTVWDIEEIKFDHFNLNYTFDNVQRVQTVASRLYQNERVNFIFNTNNWFNNAIASAASHTAQMSGYTKTIKFITNNVFDKDDYKYKDVNYLLFSYYLNVDILQYTIENNKIPEEYQVLDTAVENIHAYGLNDTLRYVDGL